MSDSDYINRFRRAYLHIVHHVDALRLRVWEEKGLTLPQLRLLFIIRANPDCTTNYLATRLGITMSTVSGQVDKLVRAGLVERGHDPKDRRVVPLHLTSEGESVVGEIRHGNRVYLAGLAESLGDDLLPLTEALEKLAEVTDKYPV